MRGDLGAFWPNVVSLVYGCSTLLSLVLQSATTYLKIKIRASGGIAGQRKSGAYT